MSSELKILTRDVEASVVPVGTKVTLQKGEQAHITQSLGGTYTVIVNGNMFRIESKDADALGLEVAGCARRHRRAERPADAGAAGKGSLGIAQDLLRPGNSRQHRGPRLDLRLPSHAHRRETITRPT